ncbi:MAG: hypothetical protein Q4P36_03750 [Bowdeniella nasicola]|nr:hypothetical protein [Bowdeniella nasicola]
MQKDLPGIFYAENASTAAYEIAERPAPEGWEVAYGIAKDGEDLGWVAARHTLVGRLAEAYPVGARDLEIDVHTEHTEALNAITYHMLELDPACRRIVLATAAGDIPAIDFGERAGYRYVVDVEIFEGSEFVDLSLLVAEPEWVLKEPRAIETRAGH